ERRVDRANTVELRLLLQNLLENLCGPDVLTAIEENLRAKRSDERMIRFDGRAGIKFGQRFVVLSLIHEDARPVVTCDNAFSRTEPRHAFQRSQRLVVITIKPRNHRSLKMNTGIVGGFMREFFGRLSRPRFLAARKIDEHHVTTRLERIRIQRERLIESFCRRIVIARLACALDHAIYISLAEAAERQRKRRIEIS